MRTLTGVDDIMSAEQLWVDYFSSHQRGEIMRGYLTKRGHVAKSWKHRFFVLQDRKLLYFAVNRTTGTHKGEVNIVGARVIVLTPADCFDREFGFSLVLADGQVHYYDAACERDRTRWVSALSHQLVLLNTRTRVSEGNDGCG